MAPLVLLDDPALALALETCPGCDAPIHTTSPTVCPVCNLGLPAGRGNNHTRHHLGGTAPRLPLGEGGSRAAQAPRAD